MTTLISAMANSMQEQIDKQVTDMMVKMAIDSAPRFFDKLEPGLPTDEVKATSTIREWFTLNGCRPLEKDIEFIQSLIKTVDFMKECKWQILTEPMIYRHTDLNRLFNEKYDMISRYRAQELL